MLRDRIDALLRLIPVIGPEEEECGAFSEVEPETHADDEGDDRVHAQSSSGAAGRG